MKTILKLEETVMFISSIFIFNMLPFKWWIFPALLLIPDIGIMGYLINPKAGAFSYNIFHHKGIALIIGMAGFYFQNNYMLLAGTILFAHSSMDRIFGYGLKYEDSFSNTHLGKIGKQN